MSKVLVDDQNLTAIADSIRSKNGTETSYKPSQMASAIDAIDGQIVLTSEIKFRQVTGEFPDWLKNADTSNLRSLYQMFYYCTTLTKADMSQWDLKNAEDMSYVFQGDSNLTEVSLEGTNLHNVTNFVYMCASCGNLIRFNIDNIIPPENVVNCDGMFDYCYKIQSIDLRNIPFALTANSNPRYMFRSCAKLDTLKLGIFDTSLSKYFDEMFYNCSALTNFDFSIFNCSNATNMLQMLYGCTSLSNESLNSVLQMCTTAENMYSTNKTLKYLGLTQAQAETCTTLSNYQAFLDAGWTTGY